MSQTDQISAYLAAHADVRAMPDAAAAAALSVPSLAAKAGDVTLKSLAAVWGLDRAAAFREWLSVASLSGGGAGAFAATVLDLLTGTGFNASHPDVLGAVARLVDAGACTQEEAVAVLYDASYPAGTPGPVSPSEVATARVSLAREDAAANRQAAWETRRNEWAELYGRGDREIQRAFDAGEELPSIADLLAFVSEE